MARQQVTGGKGAQTAKKPPARAEARKPKPRPASKGPRQRRPSSKPPPADNAGHYPPGHNSHTGETHRRGPDLIGRGTVSSLYTTLLNDDGTLEASLQGDNRFRALLAMSFFRAVKDVENPRLGPLAAETIADRLEGRPVQKVEGIVFPQAVFYRQGDPPPEGVALPASEQKAVADTVALDGDQAASRAAYASRAVDATRAA